MQLFLVQHGASKTEAEDLQRSLTDEGRRTVGQMAALLARLGLGVDRIEHSDKLRARQTAEILAGQLRPREGTKPVAGMAPNDDVEPIVARLAREEKNLLLVGHLPHLSRLVARLLGLDANRLVVQFQMGGVVRMDRDDALQWSVRWIIVPEVIGPFM